MRKWMLRIAGVIALAVGLLWAGQGAGIIRWPRSSFMVDETNWIYFGGALAALGLLILWRARR